MNDLIKWLKDYSELRWQSGFVQDKLLKASEALEYLVAASEACAHVINKRDAEIERLRLTLKTIADQDSGIVGSTSLPDCMASIAQAALSSDKETGE